MSVRMLRWAFVGACALFPTIAAAQGDAFPGKPITLMVPWPAGGGSDTIMRMMAEPMSKAIGQPVVVVNKPGAAGAIGAHAVATAKADGYTILIHVPAISTIPEVDTLFGRAPKFTRDQFVPVARLNADPTIIVANSDTPWKSLKDVLEDVKKRPGEITFSSSGPYGASHVPMEMLLQAGGGLKMRHLPTTGGGPATTAVLGNHAQLWCSPPGVASPHLKSGKLRALAVTGAQRHPYFPDVPTLKELGYDVEYYLWTAIFAPRDTPAGALKVLRDGVRRAVQEGDFKAAMDKIQVPVAYQDADEFKAWLDQDSERLAQVIKRIGKVAETN
jgi:tripartite-type tricarboxylate transporter receptor subunit TctC